MELHEGFMDGLRGTAYNNDCFMDVMWGSLYYFYLCLVGNFDISMAFAMGLMNEEIRVEVAADIYKMLDKRNDRVSINQSSFSPLPLKHHNKRLTRWLGYKKYLSRL